MKTITHMSGLLFTILLLVNSTELYSQQISLDETDMVGYSLERKSKNHWLANDGKINNNVSVQKWKENGSKSNIYIESCVFNSNELAVENCVVQATAFAVDFIEITNKDRVIGNRTWDSPDKSAILFCMDNYVVKVFQPGMLEKKSYHNLYKIAEKFVKKYNKSKL